MRGNDVLGLVFANEGDEALSEITGFRSMASVPFGGNYRLIDFVLSSMVNSGVKKVGILTNNNYQSLMDHIGSGKPWDLARRREGLYLLPPFNADEIENYNASRIGALKNIMEFLEKSSEEYVLLSDCTCVANLDFTEVFDYFEKTEADIVILYKHGTVTNLKGQTVIEKTENGRITKLVLADSGKKGDYGLKISLMKKSLLQRLVSESFAKGNISFEKDIIMKNIKKLHIAGFEVKGFCAVIDSLKSYFDANFALLQPENYDALFSPERPVYTKVYEDMPAVYGLGSSVKNSLIADGCVIDGTVENSILFRDCRVEKDAEIKNCVLMPHTFVAEAAKLGYCITDKAVAVRGGKIISGADTYPVYIGKGIHI